jgi:uncharacterized protein YneR
MKLTVSEAALAYFQNDWRAKSGDSVRIFARYGAGISPQGSFSLGIAIEPPQVVSAAYEIAGILFYISESDAWYFDDKNLTVDYDQPTDELVTIFH